MPVGDALPALDAWAEADEWLPVELTGRYLVDQQLLVRNRPYNGASGFEVLVPFELDDGRVFVVDRGWVPVGSSIEAPDAVPAPPDGDVTVVARLKPGEPTLPGRTAPEGQLATIHLPSVAELVGDDTYTGAYGLLASEDPAPASAPSRRSSPRPTRDRTSRTRCSGSRSACWRSWRCSGRSGASGASPPCPPTSRPRPAPRSAAAEDTDYEDAAARPPVIE